MKKLGGFKVLIVDDDPDLSEIVSEVFTISGAETESAENGTVAIGLIRSKKFDFILSDMRMPNGDGRFLAKEILKMEGSKPLIFLYSGYNDIEPSEAKELNIAQIFIKPYELSKIIESVLSHFS